MRTEQVPARGFLRSVGVTPEILVEFQYNPTQLTDKRSVNYSTVNAPGQLMPLRYYNQGGERTITFTTQIDGLFRGPVDNPSPIATDADGGIAPELNKYRAFLYPQRDDWEDAGFSFVPLYTDELEFTTPPTAQFGFGERGEPEVIDCVVTEVSVQETLFNENLAPLRAEVSVTLVELVPYGLEAASAGGP
jgi:Contractile injection system tube protein